MLTLKVVPLAFSTPWCLSVLLRQPLLPSLNKANTAVSRFFFFSLACLPCWNIFIRHCCVVYQCRLRLRWGQTAESFIMASLRAQRTIIISSLGLPWPVMSRCNENAATRDGPIPRINSNTQMPPPVPPPPPTPIYPHPLTPPFSKTSTF